MHPNFANFNTVFHEATKASASPPKHERVRSHKMTGRKTTPATNSASHPADFNSLKSDRVKALECRIRQLCKVNVYTASIADATTSTLLAIIEERVQPDSIVYTDCFGAYDALAGYGRVSS